MIAYLEDHDTTVDVPDDTSENELKEINKNFASYIAQPTPAQAAAPGNAPTGNPGNVPQGTPAPQPKPFIQDFYQSHLKPAFDAAAAAGKDISNAFLNPEPLAVQAEKTPTGQVFAGEALKEATFGLAKPLIEPIIGQEEADHPIAATAGQMTGMLGSLLATGGALKIAGLGVKAAAFGQAATELAEPGTALGRLAASAVNWLPKAIMTGSTFGTQTFIAQTVKMFQDGNVDLPTFGKQVLGKTALNTIGGAVMGGIGRVTNVPISMFSAAGLWFTLAKSEGASNREAMLSASVGFAFEGIGSFAKTPELIRDTVRSTGDTIGEYIKAKDPDIDPKMAEKMGRAFVDAQIEKNGGIEKMGEKANALQTMEDINQAIRQGKVPNPIQAQEPQGQIEGRPEEQPSVPAQISGPPEAGISAPASPPSTVTVPPPLEGSRYGAARTPGEVFPPTQISSDPSIAEHPAYKQLTKDAEAVVQKYADIRGVPATAQLGESIFTEIHTDQHNTTRAALAAKTPEERASIMEDFNKKWPDADNEFTALYTKFMSDETEFFFKHYEAKGGNTMRPQVAVDAENAAKGALTMPAPEPETPQSLIEKGKSIAKIASDLISSGAKDIPGAIQQAREVLNPKAKEEPPLTNKEVHQYIEQTGLDITSIPLNEIQPEFKDLWHRQMIEREKKELPENAFRKPGTVVSSIVTPAGDRVNITHNDVLNEAKGLHQQAMEQRTSGELEKFISENPINAKGADIREELKSIPLRFKDNKSGGTVDEVAQRAFDRGLIEEPNGDLLLNHLRDIPIRGAEPRPGDFYDEAQRNLEQFYSTLPEEKTGNFSIAPKIPTNSEAFKKWFGDSKVVDEKGQPLVVYHGTSSGGFTEFSEPGIEGKFPYFTTNPKTASMYASARGLTPSILPVYLSIKNPITKGEFELIGKSFEKAKMAGYDGFIVHLKYTSLQEGEIHYIPFESSQIKSAIGNKGTFDAKTPNINFSLAPTPKENVTDRYERLLKQATDQGLNPAQAAKWAKAQLTGKPEAKTEPKPKQQEFGAEGGIQSFGRGREGENELSFSMAATAEPPTRENMIKQIGTHLKESATEIRDILAPAKAKPLAAEITIEELGIMARSYDQAESAFNSAIQFFDKQSAEFTHDFIDKWENGQKQSQPALDSMVDQGKSLLDLKWGEYEETIGKTKPKIPNYFPHDWNQDDKQISTAIEKAAKRPFAGTQRFRKQRTIATVKQGLGIGLVERESNPFRAILNKIREMDKFIAAYRIMKKLDAVGLAKTIMGNGKPPLSWEKIDDRISTIFKSPMVAVQEAFDAEMVNKLNTVADSLGIDLERKTEIGRHKGIPSGVWGYSESAEGKPGKITTKFGGPESVIAHELGHQLDSIYGLQQKFLTPESENEFTRLAEQRAPEDADQKFKKYIQKPTERMAVMLESYIHAPELFKEVAPNLFNKFDSFLKSKTELQPLTEIKPSLVMGTAKSEINVGGAVIAGHIWAHPDATRIINNYLSPGLQKSKIYQLLRNASNIQNQAQLGFSAFHAGFVTTNSWVGQFALAINQLELGHPIKAVLAAMKTPVAPIADIISGNNIAKAWRGQGRAGSDEVMATAMAMGGGRARMDQFYQTRMMDYMKKNFSEGNYVRGILQTPLALIEATSKPVLEWMVPRMKMGAFANIMRMEMEHDPNMTHEQARSIEQRAWRTIDNRLGQLVYDNLFWNRTLKDSLMLAFRSVGWNLGSGSILFGGIQQLAHDIPKEKLSGEKAKTHYDAAYLIALPIIMATVNAIYQYFKTGKGPDELKDYVYPKNGGTDQDGRPSRSAFASYEKDFMGFATAPVQTVINKINPMISDLYRMYTNQDFFGVKIRNEDDPIMKQLADEIKYKLKQMTPFSISNLGRNLSTNRHSPADVIESWTGINPAPWNVNQTPAEKLAHEYAAQHYEIGGRTQAQADKSRLMSLLEREYKNDRQVGLKEMMTDFDEHRISSSDMRTIITRARLTPLQRLVRGLDADQLQHVYDKANDEEKAQIQTTLQRKELTAERKK